MASNPASGVLTNPNATRQKRNVAFNDIHSPRFALPLPKPKAQKMKEVLLPPLLAACL
jgi:hypothetical protein